MLEGLVEEDTAKIAIFCMGVIHTKTVAACDAYPRHVDYRKGQLHQAIIGWEFINRVAVATRKRVSLIGEQLLDGLQNLRAFMSIGSHHTSMRQHHSIQNASFRGTLRICNVTAWHFLASHHIRILTNAYGVQKIVHVLKNFCRLALINNNIFVQWINCLEDT